MALRWDFNQVSGTITYGGKTFRWFEGNARMIILNEFQENGKEMYNLEGFSFDDDHLKNILGITKGHTNVYVDFGTPVTQLTVYRKYTTNWDKLIKIFVKAFPEIEITLKDEEGK